MKNKIWALALFILCFVKANAQDTLSLDKGSKTPVKTETKFHPSAELQLMVGANFSQTYNGIHADLLPAAVYGAKIDYGCFSVFAHGLSCFSSLPMPDQKYKMLTGELCFGLSVKEDENKTTTLKFGKILFPGKYGLAANKSKFSSTDVLYDMFKLNNDRALKRGCAVIQTFNKVNIAFGYTEQDGTSGFKFNGKNANLVLSGGYDSKIISAQFVYFYSIENKSSELNCYIMCKPDNKNMIICKVLGIASDNPIYEIAYSHDFKKLSLSVVAIVGKDKFADVDINIILPYNIFVNLGVVNNDPYFENKGLNPKLGIGFHYLILNKKTR